MEQTTENLKLENDTFALKRDYKYALENLTTVKKDTATILSIKEKTEKELAEKREELKKVLNDISQEKLDWANHRHSELMELENKQSEAQNILKRKGELNDQEERLRKIEENDIEVRNETRRLELKIEQDKVDLGVREKELEETAKKLGIEKLEIKNDKENFKASVLKVLKSVEKF